MPCFKWDSRFYHTRRPAAGSSYWKSVRCTLDDSCMLHTTICHNERSVYSAVDCHSAVVSLHQWCWDYVKLTNEQLLKLRVRVLKQLALCPPVDIRAVVIVWMIRAKIVRIVICCNVCHSWAVLTGKLGHVDIGVDFCCRCSVLACFSSLVLVCPSLVFFALIFSLGCCEFFCQYQCS